LSLDQGTTSTRAVIFDAKLRRLAWSQRELPQHYPQGGWVEHNPEDIWDASVQVCRAALSEAGLRAGEIAAIGITNQRESAVIWERQNGQAIHNAIVWQDRRTAGLCESLSEQGLGPLIESRTGLLLDPYFSATKIRWLLDQVPHAREKAARGELAFGTIDTFLMWRLSGGKVHKTDASNASRTMLFDIHRQRWDEEILARLDIPYSLLPEVVDSAGAFGMLDAGILGAAIPICGVAGDQQAALLGQACTETGMSKCTFGTGSFLICNTGSAAIKSDNRLLTTVAYRLEGAVTYGLEGSVFVAGSAIQWLRDGLKLITDASETEAIARQRGIVDELHVVPAFTGLGAPHWDPHARGAILGLTRNSGVADIVTATLQSVAFQCKDLVATMALDGAEISRLRVDGGMVNNGWFTQFLADILNLPVERPVLTESTAVGAASLAGLGCGMFASLEDAARHWRCDTSFRPRMRGTERERLYAGWLSAVKRIYNGSAVELKPVLRNEDA